MKIRQQKHRSGVRGFTLIEMSIGLVLAMAIAGTVVLLLQQHVSFLTILDRFSFLRDDAPATAALLGRIVQQSDAHRVYPSSEAAKARTRATTTGGSAVWLRFRNPGGAPDQAIIAFDRNGDSGSLNFYHHDGTSWATTPSWTISSKPDDVVFENDSGILLITLTGPNGEQITYAGASQ